MKTLVSLIAAFLCAGYAALAADCPPDDPNCPWTIGLIRTVSDPATGCEFEVTHDIRYCNGVLEVRYTNISTPPGGQNCQFMENFSIYHYNISSQMELIDILMLRQDMKDHFTIDLGQTLPPCPDNTREFAKFYGAACGVWVKCTYELDPATMNRQCEVGYEPPYPDYNEGTKRKVDVWKWQPCGETCCRRVYSVCEEFASGHPSSGLRIMNMRKEKITQCTQEPGGTTPKYAKPCQDGC